MVEVQSVYGCADRSVFENTFGTIAKRKDADPSRSNRNTGGKPVHLFIIQWRPRAPDTRKAGFLAGGGVDFRAARMVDHLDVAATAFFSVTR